MAKHRYVTTVRDAQHFTTSYPEAEKAILGTMERGKVITTGGYDYTITDIKIHVDLNSSIITYYVLKTKAI